MTFLLATAAHAQTSHSEPRAERNVALASFGTAVRADSEWTDSPFVAAGEGASHLTDGVRNEISSKPEYNRWHSAPKSPHPHWIWLRFPVPCAIRRVVLWRTTLVDYPVEFKVQYSNGNRSQLIDLVHVREAEFPVGRLDLAVDFPRVITNNLRLIILRSSNAAFPNYAQLSELEVIGTPAESEIGRPPPLSGPTANESHVPPPTTEPGNLPNFESARSTHLVSLLLRAWDVFVASTPILTAFLAGVFLWRALGGRLAGIPKDSFSGILVSGGAIVQLATWLGALFSAVFVAVVQYAALVSGFLVLVLLVWPAKRLRGEYQIFGMALARVTAFVSLTAGFVLAGSYVPQSIPSDALAYHIPVSSWFARGGAWAYLPHHIWPAQWPLASSLWSSFVMGYVPVADRLVAWSAQNYAFIVWTGAIVFSTIKSPAGAHPPGDPRAWLLSILLVLGAYLGFQRFGFVDYRAGFFAAALTAALAQMPVSTGTLPLAVLLASPLAEFRPQGLLYAVSLLICWLGISALPPADNRAPHGHRQGRRGIFAVATLLLAGFIFAKWWLLVWMRWGSPAPPIFARRLGLTPTLKYADELFSYLWTPDLWRGLKFVFFGNRNSLVLTFLLWTLGVLAIVSAVLSRRSRVREERPIVQRVPPASLTILSPVAACGFLAAQVPSEASRMLPPIIPAACIIAFTILNRSGAADPTAKRIASLFPWLLVAVSAVAIPPLGRPHPGRTYPTQTTVYYSRVEEQLNKLRDRRPLVFDQYIPFLPIEIRQMGVTYGPWARFPEWPLRNLDIWMEWLRENGIGAVLVQKGKDLKSTWEWTQERTETPDFSVLDRWMSRCANRVVVGQWIACPVVSPGLPRN